MRYIVFFFLVYGPSLNAQVSSERHKELADSFQKIIGKQSNDTAVIFYELEKDNHIVFDHPERSLKIARPLYALARRTGHGRSIGRIYFMWGRALWRMAEMENDLARKERLLARADSIADKHLAFALNELSGEERINEAEMALGLYSALSDRSAKKREHYFKKRVEGYHLLVDKYQLRNYPKKFVPMTFGLAVIHQSYLKTSQAVKYYLSVAEYADSIKEYDRASECYNNLGFTFFADGNLVAAQRYYFLSLKCSEKFPPDSFTVTEGHKDRIANVGITLSNIANVFWLQKNNTQAVEFYKKALPYYNKGGAHEIYMATLVRIGNIYAGMNELDSAEAYYRKEKKLTYLLKDKNQLLIHEMRSNGLKGFILAQKKHYREAIIVGQNVVRLAEQIGNPQGKMVAYESLGNYYVKSGQAEKGIDYYNKQLSLTDRKSGWVEKYLSKIYINKGKAFMEMGRSDSAIACLLMAKDLAEKKNIKLEMNAVYQALSEAYIKANDMANAVVYLKKHIQYKDSLMGDQVTQEVTSMGLKYESDLKLMQEKSIREKQRLENEKKTEEQAQQRRILIIIILSVSLLVLIATYSLFRIKKANVLLASQKTEIEAQRNLVTHQKHIVEEKNKEITDSIQYAKRIQKALINTEPYITQNTKDHFILFKPKDIVSGDFYWAAQKNEHVYIAACDCTGHGVPGAFMSLLNISFLNEAVIQKELLEPNDVFNYVKHHLVSHLAAEESKDGMDACLLHINKQTKKITYAAANNKPLIVRNDEMIELPCDKMPVGESIRAGDFQLYTIDYQENDLLYLFTDGFKDQFGSKSNKKLNSKMFKQLLLQYSKLAFASQKQKLSDFFNEWKGSLEQTDDVCVIGLKL